ncbi:adenylate/guanylate cyclase domain-containing protein [Patiriisocius sp. Uisw_017]|jgi:adenylate cyclase|uniref:adenylate/guanylate cyclase domain-containing protein n=1 Tax=Patiriisocius sp. Uisw_017 TaxID=3230968 RepID=UPI0039E79364
MNIKNRNLSEYLKHLLRSTLFWTIAMMLFVLFRYYALNSEVGIEINAKYKEIYTIYNMIFDFGLGGFLIGVLYATIEFYFDKFILKRISIGLNILIQTVLIFISALIISYMMTNLSIKINSLPYSIDISWWYRDHSFRPILIYFTFSSFVFSIITIVSDKFGKGVFFKMLIGKYKQPKEEERIFLFLDLKSSTSIAEIIGHFKYSQLIQDCFYDLNEIMTKYGAEIYQYVGDEAVISWPYKKGILNNNCVNLFFSFQQRIQSKANFYLKKYNTLPEFKAGLHGGPIMVAEVGVVKKELAYHGDVINTAARIQGQCNVNNVPILISESLLNNLDIEPNFTSEFIGNILLKGKEKEISIHTIIGGKEFIS